MGDKIMDFVLSLYLGVVISICFLTLLESHFKKLIRCLFILVTIALSVSLYRGFNAWVMGAYIAGLTLSLLSRELIKVAK